MRVRESNDRGWKMMGARKIVVQREDLILTNEGSTGGSEPLELRIGLPSSGDFFS
jgi:hypothetical protein